ncbi:MAG: lecithin retinol acyltransferase family protein [Candidatus Moeniiplasma glomeromycotorum]|nr:lecithin retinol acyltransferase family protein [Candidatus Moeniiplasma glomeromycotorum]MCE8168483.1 lecithin retinol acyltransferase family protein [Candidatus Moeniiplasma glomeromycotorum]MCE8170000.1 lecithin retinol acyltransferase family protein [Candidatus Moeniiplasma glomeromycotorum]
MTNYKELVKQRTSISGYIEEVERFKTWWSNYNVATVINYHEGYYRVFLVVYEPTNEFLKVFPDNSSYQGDYGIYVRKREKHNCFSNAQSEAGWLRRALNNENPILAIHHYANEYVDFSWIVNSPYIINYDLGKCENNTFYWPSNLDCHIKPLSVLRVKKEHKTWDTKYYHVGVYVGDNKVFHIYNWCKQAKCMKSRIDDIKTFLGDTEDTRRVGDYIEVFYPIVPFKHYKKIVRQVAYAVEEDYWKGRYCLANRNCEHLANMVAYGINYSEQVSRNPTSSRIGCKFTGSNCFSNGGCGDFQSNNGKGSTICLRKEIEETENKLGYSSSSHWQASEIQERYLQEIPPKQNCRVM